MILGEPQPRVSELLNGKIANKSADKLLTMPSGWGLKRKPNSRRHARKSRLHEAVLEAAFAIDRKRAGPLQSNDFPVAANSKTCVLDFGLRRLLVRLPQFGPKTRFAHSACFAAVALQEVMTAGRTNEVRAGHPKPV